MANHSVRSAGTNLSKLIERMEKGDEPAHVRRRRAFGALKGKLKLPDSFFFAPLPAEELDVWEGRAGPARNPT